MALQNALKRSGISIGKIQKSVTSFNSGLTQANKTTVKFNQSLSKRHKIKKKALHMDKVLFHRRRQAVKRREGEDLIEASTIQGSGKRSGKIKFNASANENNTPIDSKAPTDKRIPKKNKILGNSILDKDLCTGLWLAASSLSSSNEVIFIFVELKTSAKVETNNPTMQCTVIKPIAIPKIRL